MKKLLAVFFIGIVIGIVGWYFLEPHINKQYNQIRDRISESLGDISWIPPSIRPERPWQDDFIAVLNIERAKAGFPALIVDTQLQDIANQFAVARAMQANGESNVDFRFARPLQVRWLSYKRIYELTGPSQDYYDTLYRMFEKQMTKTMLTEYYTHAGVGKAYDKEGHVHWYLIVADKLPTSPGLR